MHPISNFNCNLFGKVECDNGNNNEKTRIERNETKKKRLTKSMKGQKHPENIYQREKNNVIQLPFMQHRFVFNPPPTFELVSVWFEYMRHIRIWNSEFQYPFYMQSAFYTVFVQFVYQTRGCFSLLRSYQSNDKRNAKSENIHIYIEYAASKIWPTVSHYFHSIQTKNNRETVEWVRQRTRKQESMRSISCACSYYCYSISCRFETIFQPSNGREKWFPSLVDSVLFGLYGMARDRYDTFSSIWNIIWAEHPAIDRQRQEIARMWEKKLSEIDYNGFRRNETWMHVPWQDPVSIDVFHKFLFLFCIILHIAIVIAKSCDSTTDGLFFRSLHTIHIYNVSLCRWQWVWVYVYLSWFVFHLTVI